MSVVAASCAASTRIVGAQGLRNADEQRAQQILNGLPQHGYYQIMLSLAAISAKGSTGETFNARWRSARNPLIAKLFRDVGYSDPVYDNCAPWCAVALAWCLQRDGRPLPSNPVASQSYLHYGTPVETPRLGDICIFTDVEDASVGHVGLFAGFAGADKVTVLGGNQKGDVDTRCGPGFLNSYITFEDVEINRARRLTDNGLYLRQIRRPPERVEAAFAKTAPAGAASPRSGASQLPSGPPSASSGAAQKVAPLIRLADFSRLTPSTADLLDIARKVEALPPLAGQSAVAVLVGALGVHGYLASNRERRARRALRAMLEAHARRQVEIVGKLAAPGLPPPPETHAYGLAVRDFALFLARAFKQIPIAKIRKSGAPAELRLKLEDLETRAPPHHSAIAHLSAVKLAVIRLLNQIDESSRRSRRYQAIFDGEVTPALWDLLATLDVDLSPEERRLILDTPVFRRPAWIRALTPARRPRAAAPQPA